MKAIFRGFRDILKRGGRRFCKYFMGKKPLDDKIHGKNCNECGGGGGGDGEFLIQGIFSNLVLAAGIFGRFDLFCPHSITSAVILLLK